MTRKRTTLTAVLRKAMQDSGTPLLTISTATGLDRASLRRFLRGERSLRLDKADALAAYFELELRKIGE